MKNTKQNYTAPSLETLNVASHSIICEGSPTNEEWNVSEFWDLDY